MKNAHELHTDQVAFWNGKAGDHWAEEQERIDAMLAPVLDALIPQAKVKSGEAILDVGCGNGASSIALAKLVGPNGRVTGLDVSAPMLERARERGRGIANLHFIHADAAAHDFAQPVADLLFSRFGLMFFGDPAAAFANLKRALKPGGRVAFACWRKIDENKWMQVPLHAAYEHVERLPKLGPEDPGPMSFADTERVTRILAAAGFAKPRFTPVDLLLDLAHGDGLESAVQQAMGMGPASRAIAEQPESVLAKVADSMRKALAPYAKGDTVKLPGAIWLVEA